ncbi:MAG: hypothetical protein VYB59_14820, partial [Pseudomonadota bacterium]|nr:hypothetical protein [Pseudomonadota bacterium]
RSDTESGPPQPGHLSTLHPFRCSCPEWRARSRVRHRMDRAVSQGVFVFSASVLGMDHGNIGLKLRQRFGPLAQPS